MVLVVLVGCEPNQRQPLDCSSRRYGAATSPRLARCRPSTTATTTS